MPCTQPLFCAYSWAHGRPSSRTLRPLREPGLQFSLRAQGPLQDLLPHSICKTMPSLSAPRALAWPLAGPGGAAVGHAAVLGLRLNPAMVGRVQRHSAAVPGPKLLGNVTLHTWLGAGGVCMCLTNSSQVALWGPGPSPAVSVGKTKDFAVLL